MQIKFICLYYKRLTNEYIASIRKTLRAAKQDDCSRLIRLREQQTPAIFFRHLGFTAARYQRGHIASVSQIDTLGILSTPASDVYEPLKTNGKAMKITLLRPPTINKEI